MEVITIPLIQDLHTNDDDVDDQRFQENCPKTTEEWLKLFERVAELQASED